MEPYGCFTQFTQDQIPNLWNLARSFAISDRTFQLGSVPSYGAHLELMSTTDYGFINNPVDSPDQEADGWGCDSHLDAWWHEARGAAPRQPAQRRFVEFGPRWDSLSRSGYGQRVAAASLQLPADYHGDLRDHALHPALVDAAIGAAIPLLPGADGDLLYAPVGCRALRAARAVPFTQNGTVVRFEIPSVADYQVVALT